MKYIINDINNFNTLFNTGIVKLIYPKCHSIAITNIMIDEYSIAKQRQIESYFNKKFFLLDVDLGYFEYAKNRNLLALGEGDKSSLYLALNTGRTIIANSPLITNIAKKSNINIISIESFINRFINDMGIINMFNEMKSA